MAEPENMVLALLREMREESRQYYQRTDEKLDRLIDDVGDLKVRMSGVETRPGHVEVSIGLINSRIDRMETRLDRIERRLELVDT